MEYNHNLRQLELFPLPFGFKCFSAYLFSHLQNKTLILCAHSFYLKLSECEDVSIIIIIQVQFCYFLGCIDSYAWLDGWGGGKLSMAVYLPPPGIKVKLFC